MFVFLVVIHELWHFAAAKLTGVKVKEFGIGIPPKLFTYYTDKSGTEYTLNAIPLWWFVRLKWEDPSDPETFRAKDSFISASFVSKTVILLAGITINLVFAWLVLTILFVKWLSPISIIPDGVFDHNLKSYLTPSITQLQEQWYLDTITTSPRITQVVPNSLAEKLQLQAWDEIVSVNDTRVTLQNLASTLNNYAGKTVELILNRGQEELLVSVLCPPQNCVLGVMIEQDLWDLDLLFVFPLWKAMSNAVNELYVQSVYTLERLWWIGKSLFSGSASQIKEEATGLSGPVGIVKIVEVFFSNQLRGQLFALAALISFALAIFNVLPIPALDGGRRLGVIIQTVFFPNKPEAYANVEGVINFVFFVLLMLLGVYIIFQDLGAAWGVKIPFIN